MCKIRRFGLQRDAFGGVIAEFAALFAANDALLGAQNLLTFQLGAIDAVVAGTLDFLLEKHTYPSLLGSLYTNKLGNATLFLLFVQKNDDCSYGKSNCNPKGSRNMDLSGL